VNAILRRIRLLPLVIVVGFVLLTVKGFGIMREAQAEGAGAAVPTEQNAGEPASYANDPAADDSENDSASEVDVLTSLTKRRKQLDEREQELAMRQNVISAAEHRVDTKISELQALQAEIQKLLGQRDAEEQKQIASLVKTYSAMKPRDAARIFDTLDEDVRIAVAQQMKPDVLAPVLSAMQSDQAQKLTLKLANRLKVTPPAVTPPPAPAAPAPDGTGAAPSGASAANTTLPAGQPPAAETPATKLADATPPAAPPAPKPAATPPAKHAAAKAPAKHTAPAAKPTTAPTTKQAAAAPAATPATTPAAHDQQQAAAAPPAAQTAAATPPAQSPPAQSPPAATPKSGG
jgi:flagellar motility protein MotE (MotC chaperone)